MKVGEAPLPTTLTVTGSPPRLPEKSLCTTVGCGVGRRSLLMKEDTQLAEMKTAKAKTILTFALTYPPSERTFLQ